VANITPAELFFMSRGPDFMAHEAFQGVHEEPGSAGWEVARLCTRCRKHPEIGKKIWLKHRASLVHLPVVRESYWAFRQYEIFEPEFDKVLEELYGY
jgi:hypothetical protein